MSFSKAKRFVYKTPDVDCSPADYLLCTKFEKGCKISSSPRFQESKYNDVPLKLCSRLLRGPYSKSSINTQRECNRSGFIRDYVNMANIGNGRTRSSPFSNWKINSQYVPSPSTNVDFYESCEFIDDDYSSLESFDDSRSLEDIDNYELNEVRHALENIYLKRKQGRKSRFENKVLGRLKKIDINANEIKDTASLPYETTLRYHDSNMDATESGHCHTFNRKKETTGDLIMKTIQKLDEALEKKGETMMKDKGVHILRVITEIYATSNRSEREIKEWCAFTTEVLQQNLNNIFHILGSEDTTGDEIEYLLHSLRLACISGKIFDNKISDPADNMLWKYIEEIREMGQELGEDLSDISFKCQNTQEKLDVQGLLLSRMKSEIQDLKSRIS